MTFLTAGFQNLLIRNFFRTPLFGLLAISCVWLMMVLLVNPVGEFPLNDDWSYSLAVQSLIETGHLTLSGFTSMPLITQVLWGALFCLPFGFSFTALRISTIALGLLGIWATYSLLQEVKEDPVTGLYAACIVAVNPIYFHLSLTFMTDVPFFTFSMLAVRFLLRALRTERIANFVLGHVFVLCALLIRQLGIVIALSFLLAYFVKNRFSLKVVVNALVPSALLVGLLLALPEILRRTVGLPALYNRAYEPILETAPLGSLRIFLVLADRLFIELIYIGLFLLPFLILLRANVQTVLSLKAKSVSVYLGWILFITMAGILFWQGRAMPLSGNVLFDLGLGPATLRDTYLLSLPHWPTAPRQFWFIVTAAALWGSVLLILGVLPAIKRISRLSALPSNTELTTIFFVFSAVVLYITAIGITGFLDRYLIWPLPFLMAVLSLNTRTAWIKRRLLPFSPYAALPVIFSLFAVGGTHDYFAWNRARWQALTDLLVKEDVSYTNIDGGFEFNGLYAYQAGYHIDPSKSPWWVDGDEYMVSFGPIPGYVELRRYPFERWIPPEQGHIFVLRRVDQSQDRQVVTR